MSSVIDTVPLFDISAEIEVAADAAAIYTVVSDLGRSGEWSPECQGGEWISGTPSTVGAVFRGRNFRPTDVVEWAPLIRGEWFTECQVVAANPGRTFQWAMHTHAGANQDSVWGFTLRPADGGTVLVHHFRMGMATQGIHHIVENLDEEPRAQFVAEWTAKLQDDLLQTLSQIKNIVENG